MSKTSVIAENPSDEELVRRVGRGDHGAFEEIYERYSVRILHYFCRMLADEPKAQDFLHELFLVVLEKNDRFDSGRSFCSWIFAVAHNMCCNEYRRLEVRRNAQEDVALICFPAGCQPAFEAIDDRRFAESLQRELENLDAARRSAFLLRYQEGFSIAAISDVLQCPAGTVKSRLFYTARALAERLREFDPCRE